MTAGTIVAIVVVVVLVAAVLLAVPLIRRRRLRARFGSEYERVVDSSESRTAAERELRERERRYAQLPVRPLPPDARERYTQQWAQVQERFVDDPESAINEADGLVTALMADRGYPTKSYEQQAADLSVQHAEALEHYRAAHETRMRAGDGEVSTEDLRKAMVHYRTLFEDLLGPGADARRDEPRQAPPSDEARSDEARSDEPRSDDARSNGEDDGAVRRPDRHEAAH